MEPVLRAEGKLPATLAPRVALGVGLGLLGVDAAVLGRNTFFVSGWGYLSLMLASATCAWAFWMRGGRSGGTLRVRWMLMAAGAGAAAMGYVPSLLEAFFAARPERVFQVFCFNASEALYILAVVLYFAQVVRSIVAVDVLQSLLFVALRYALTYSPGRQDHFTVNHLLVGQMVAAYLLLIAAVACLGAASRAEQKFLRVLCWFFGLRLAGCFLSDQVSYTWMHYGFCSGFDAVSYGLLMGFGMYVLFTSREATGEALEAPHTAPSLLVRSLMPSFLALVNLLLGLLLLRVSEVLAVAAILSAVGCYVVRTVLLQAQELKDKAVLESRNEHLEDLAIRDHLTGIGNRRSLARIYGRLHVAPAGKRLSLLLMDIDYFKQANDTHGHLHGDRVLMALASQLKSMGDGVPGSHCARLGGDEFVLLLPEVLPQTAAAVAESLRERFSEYANGEGRSRMSLSIGVASLRSAHEMTLETLVSVADEALYRAKVMGRNRVESQAAWRDGEGESTGALAVKQMQHSAG